MLKYCQVCIYTLVSFTMAAVIYSLSISRLIFHFQKTPHWHKILSMHWLEGGREQDQPRS